MKPKGSKNSFTAQALNVMSIKLPSLSVNEGMARAAVAAFCAQRSGTEPDEAELALLRSAEALAEQADHRLEPEPEQIDRLLAEALRKTKS